MREIRHDRWKRTRRYEPGSWQTRTSANHEIGGVPASGLLKHGAKALDLVMGVDKAGDAAKATTKATDASKAGQYEFNASSGDVYVGQSKDMPNRVEQHVSTGKVIPAEAQKTKMVPVEGGKTAREVAEQKRIDELGGVSALENKRNPVGRKRQYLMEESK